MTKKNAGKKSKKNNTKAEQKKRTTPNVGGHLLRAAGGLAGSYLGAMFGVPSIGDGIGTGLGASLSRWIGWGDYKLSKNSLVNGPLPGMHSNNRSVMVRHVEYVGDIKTGPVAGALNSQYFPINPGYELTFPWLSTMAQNYQQYKIKGMIFCYKSTSGDALSSTNTALGSVMMSTQYRAGAPNFTSKTQILQEDFSSDGRPSETMFHGIECNPRDSPLSVHYIRSGALNASDDVEKYDLGLFSIHTTGGQAANISIGELWVSYEIELIKPQYASLRNPNSSYFHGWNAASSNVDTTHPFGSNGQLPSVLGQTIGTFVPTLSGTTITFPLGISGFYMITWYVRGAATAITSPTLAATTNCTFPTGFLGQGSSVLNNNGTTTTTMFVAQCVNVQDSSIQAVVTWSGGTYPTAITNMDIYVIQVPDNGQTAL